MRQDSHSRLLTGNYIKYLREARGLTQLELAKILGIPTSQLGMAELAKRDLESHIIAQLIASLQLTKLEQLRLFYALLGKEFSQEKELSGIQWSIHSFLEAVLLVDDEKLTGEEFIWLFERQKTFSRSLYSGTIAGLLKEYRNGQR